ncbi:MAG TPA: coiled-coil domain-containing protein [Stellaceae bacterium]|jgi:hypothetical protein
MPVTCVTRGFDAIHDNVATKADLREMETRLQANIDAIRVDLRSDIDTVRSALKGEIGAVRADLKGDIATLRTEIERVRSELIRWVVGIGFAQVAMIIAVLKLAPGGHP